MGSSRRVCFFLFCFVFSLKRSFLSCSWGPRSIHCATRVGGIAFIHSPSPIGPVCLLFCFLRWGGGNVFVVFRSPCRSLWVGNVTTELTEKHLRDLFKAYEPFQCNVANTAFGKRTFFLTHPTPELFACVAGVETSRASVCCTSGSVLLSTSRAPTRLLTLWRNLT